jgi:hypothetical protein
MWSGVIVRAIADYSSKVAGQITMRADDLLNVRSKLGKWLEVENAAGGRGRVPASYVVILTGVSEVAMKSVHLVTEADQATVSGLLQLRRDDEAKTMREQAAEAEERRRVAEEADKWSSDTSFQEAMKLLEKFNATGSSNSQSYLVSQLKKAMHAAAQEARRNDKKRRKKDKKTKKAKAKQDKKLSPLKSAPDALPTVDEEGESKEEGAGDSAAAASP